MATALKIRPTNTSVNGTYSVENNDAYQNGKAAKVAAPAVISQTSLPSHVGPMALTKTRRSRSSLVTKG